MAEHSCFDRHAESRMRSAPSRQWQRGRKRATATAGGWQEIVARDQGLRSSFGSVASLRRHLAHPCRVQGPLSLREGLLRPRRHGVSARWAAALYGEALITLAADDDASRHGACSRALIGSRDDNGLWEETMIFHKSLCGGVASAGSWRRRNGQKTRPILASSSPRSPVPSARPAIFTRRSTAPAATWSVSSMGRGALRRGTHNPRRR